LGVRSMGSSVITKLDTPDSLGIQLDR
jgi:hypothetical protein